MNYILDGKHIPVKIEDSLEWAKWFEKTERHVDKTYFGKIFISTVFLGIDHSFGYPSAKPILFETMIFECPEFQDYQERCSTWEEAKQMHKVAVNLVKAYLEKLQNESL